MSIIRQHTDQGSSAVSLDDLRTMRRRNEWSDIISAAPAVCEAPKVLSDPEKLCEALNIWGEAERQWGDPELASSCFQYASETMPSKPDGFVNWAALEARIGAKAFADRIVHAGLANNPENPELLMLEEAVTGRPSVSVCMIVKNEEEHLPRCLESIRDIADEIILVDTGSTDNTVKIAETFGCKVFHQAWEGDFSKHRNYSMQQATSDWILIIDADEELHNQDRIALTDSIRNTTADILSVTVYNIAERTGKGTTFLPSVRLFRRELELQYNGIVHNRLNYSTSHSEERTAVRINHYGYDLAPDKMQKKHERSMALLEKQLADDESNAYAHFHYAQLVRAKSNLKNDRDSELVLTHAQRVIELTAFESIEFQSIHLMAHHQVATALYALKRFDEAEQYCLEALKMKPDYLDAVITLGYIYLQGSRYVDAEMRFKEYLSLQSDYDEHAERTNLIMAHLDSRYNALYNLGLVAEAKRDWTAAQSYFNETLSERPDYLDAHARLGWALYNLGQHESALAEFQSQVQVDASNELGYLGIATIHRDNGNIEHALNVVTDAVSLIATSPELWRLKGELELAKSDLESAEMSLNRAEGLSADLPRVAFNLGNLAWLRNDAETARKWYSEALNRDEEFTTARRNLALAQAKLHEYDLAVENLERYLHSVDSDNEVKMLLGRLYAKTSAPSRAIEYLERLVQANPSDIEALLAMADVYLEFGSVDAAKLGYSAILRSNPDHKVAKSRLAKLPA